MNLARRAALCGLGVAFCACHARQESRANPNNQAPTAAISSLAAPPSTIRVTVPSAAPQANTCPALAAALSDPPHQRVLKEVKAAPRALSAHLGLWLADEQHAILSAMPQATWATGTPSFLGHNTAVRRVVMARLPKPLRAWLGRPVRVLGANGAVCETRLQRFSLRAQVTPDPAQAEIWDGCGEQPMPSAAIAQQIWDLAGSSGRQLVAEFSAPCQGALLAVDPDLPAPAISAPEPASAELGERAQSEFRKLPAYAEVQARFKTEHPGAQGAWDDHEARRSVWSLNLPAHTPLVFVSVEVGSGCSTPPTGFSASLSAVWAANGAAPLALLVVPGALDDRRLTPRAVLDLEGDGGTQVLLGPDGLFAARAVLGRSKTAGYAKVLLSSVPFFIDPC